MRYTSTSYLITITWHIRCLLFIYTTIVRKKKKGLLLCSLDESLQIQRNTTMSLLAGQCHALYNFFFAHNEKRKKKIHVNLFGIDITADQEQDCKEHALLLS